MRELDALLGSFVEEVYSSLPPEDKRRFSNLLDLPDPDIHAYLVGRHIPLDPGLVKLLDRIRVNRST
jgi:succinate dehydrogenase flavin-adding protein (antitoxin of CptAB toxin-antitoxin module)